MDIASILSDMTSPKFPVAMWALNMKVSEHMEDVYLGALLPMIKEMASCRKDLPHAFSPLCSVTPMHSIE